MIWLLSFFSGAEVYCPELRGKQNLLVAAGKVVAMGSDLSLPSGLGEVRRFDLSGLKLVPGFIDQHVHMSGGGGEGGFQNRTPEVMLTHLTRAGITTAVGLLGTDATTRSIQGLLAKARGLEEEGVTTYIYTGAYEVPTRTLTESARSDLILIDKVIGVGEVAIADHRSAHPSDQELIRLASEARVGGMLSGKAGVLHLHVGDGPHRLSSIFHLLENTDLPVEMFVPTHLNRNQELLEDAVRLGIRGGRLDLTSVIRPTREDRVSVKPAEAVRFLLKQGIPIEQITVSSDSNGSSPLFDEKGHLVAMDVASPATLWEEVRDSVLETRLSLADALRLITSNVAETLKLPRKGVVKVGADADFVVLNDRLQIEHVFAGGRVMVWHGEPVVVGTFEQKAQAPGRSKTW